MIGWCEHTVILEFTVDGERADVVITRLPEIFRAPPANDPDRHSAPPWWLIR